MKVICSYDLKYEKLLEEIVSYTLCRYAQDLDLSGLEVIELLDIKEFGYTTDGKMMDNGTKIVLTSRLFDKLPVLQIEELYSNEDFQLIVNTLYHEMGHISDMKKYPNLYESVFEFEDEQKALPAMLWLEYLAEKRSVSDNENTRQFCEQFITADWKPVKFNYEDASFNNLFYLDKVLPYFLSRCMKIEEVDYIEQIKDNTIKNYVIDIKKEILKLEIEIPFDNQEKLDGLYDIMKQYKELLLMK